MSDSPPVAEDPVERNRRRYLEAAPASSTAAAHPPVEGCVTVEDCDVVLDLLARQREVLLAKAASVGSTMARLRDRRQQLVTTLRDEAGGSWTALDDILHSRSRSPAR